MDWGGGGVREGEEGEREREETEWRGGCSEGRGIVFRAGDSVRFPPSSLSTPLSIPRFLRRGEAER